MSFRTRLITIFFVLLLRLKSRNHKTMKGKNLLSMEHQFFIMTNFPLAMIPPDSMGLVIISQK